jgi:hypothetical protein
MQTNVSAFFKTLNEETMNEKLAEFSHFDVSLKKQIFKHILEKLSLSYSGINKYHEHFVFLNRAMTSEMDIEVQKELLRTILFKSPIRVTVGSTEEIVSAISELTYLESIRKDIRKNKLIDSIISEFRSSMSFAIAGITAKIIVDFLPELDDKELNDVIDAAIENRQIYDSGKAQSYLKQIILTSQDRIPSEKIKKLEELIAR